MFELHRTNRRNKLSLSTTNPERMLELDFLSYRQNRSRYKSLVKEFINLNPVTFRTLDQVFGTSEMFPHRTVSKSHQRAQYEILRQDFLKRFEILDEYLRAQE